ncbi:MAG: hypothetical protein IJS05_08280 [Paludibacteraceae bacterium]|nr:hypothetical protein [Paludibacteraceae bacterium]
MKKSFLTLFLLSFVCAIAVAETAQSDKQTSDSKTTGNSVRNYLEIAGQGGVSSFVGNPHQGYFAPGYNAGLGFYYILRSLPYHIGMRTGLAAESSQSVYKISDYSDTYLTVDAAGDPLEVNYNIGNINDTHTQFYFTIPIQFSVFGKNLAFHVGPKLSVTLTDFSSQDLYSVQLGCYYPNSGKRVDNDANLSAGFQPQQTLSVKHDKILPKIWLSAAAELTYDVNITKNYCITFGLYADYAINQYTVDKTTNPSLLYLTKMSDDSNVLIRKSDSALRGNYNGDQLVEKFGYFSAGFKVAFKVWGY